jgi:hypothetical protein
MIKGEYFTKMGNEHMMTAQTMDELRARILVRYPHILRDLTADVPFRDQTHLYPAFEQANPGYTAGWPWTTNSWGMRQAHEPLKDVDVSYYGCSVTWGCGVPDKAMWTNQVSSRMNWTRSNNWGYMGISTEECVNLFAVTSQFVQMRHAVFMIPGINRLMLAFESGKDADGFKEWQYKYITGEQDTISEDRDINRFSRDYYLLDHEYFYERILRDLSLIRLIALERGIKVYVCSWSNHNYIWDQLHWPNITWIPNLLPMDKGGLDQRHPGCAWHADTALRIASAIEASQ